jgi:hypothetical protein
VAALQVYAARAVSLRGAFSLNTWISVEPTRAPRYRRYEVLGFGVANGAQPSALTGWAPAIIGLARGHMPFSTGAARMSMR